MEPTRPSASAQKKGAPPRLRCESCMDDIRDNDALKLTCQSGHILCGECSAVYCESIMAEGALAVLPNPKCSICRAPIPAVAFERCLKPEQYSQYLSYVAVQNLQEGESLFSCVNCQYSEIRVDSPPLFFCQHPGCQTVHCGGCKKKFPPLDEEDDDDDAFAEGQNERVRHLMCHELRAEKAAFDKAMAAGNGMPCPGCGVIGRKDGMCTHMSCSGCSTVWCYLCGLSVDDCDKAVRSGAAAEEPIYGHNENWKDHPTRCPMYISQIAEVDDDWDLVGQAEDEDGSYDEEYLEELCLNKFHKWRALQELKVCRRADKFERLLWS